MISLHIGVTKYSEFKITIRRDNLSNFVQYEGTYFEKKKRHKHEEGGEVK